MRRVALLFALTPSALALCTPPLATAGESPSPAAAGGSPSSAAEGKAVFKLGLSQGFDGFNPSPPGAARPGTPSASATVSALAQRRRSGLHAVDLHDRGDSGLGQQQLPSPEHDGQDAEQLQAVDPEDPSDPTKRAEIVHEMQEALCRDSHCIVLWHDINLQAWRTDK